MSCEDENLEYILNCTYKGMDQYECPYCGYIGPVLEVPEGSPCPECPICRDPPQILPCPFCGSAAVGINWNPDDDDNCCAYIECKCECNTGLRLYPADAAKIWNARYNGPAGDPPQAPEPGILECRVKRYRGQEYRLIHCLGCGDEFDLYDLNYGDTVECPACREIRRLTPTLKPCPCCGGTPEFERRRDEDLDECYSGAYYWVIHCTKCGIQTPHAEDPDEDLAKIWNRRPSEDAPGMSSDGGSDR